MHAHGHSQILYVSSKYSYSITMNNNFIVIMSTSLESNYVNHIYRKMLVELLKLIDKSDRLNFFIYFIN